MTSAPKPKPAPNKFHGSTPEKDANGKWHYKSFQEMVDYIGADIKPKAVKGDGSKFIKKFGKEK